MPVRDANITDTRGNLPNKPAGRSSAFERVGIFGLTLACGVWMVLLSPRTISGMPTSNAGTKVQAQANSPAVPADNTTVMPVALAAPLAVPDDAIPAGLKISPSQTEMSVGKTQKLQLVDQNGHAVPGATWMVSDFTIAELDSIEPARIAAVAPGQVTVTAMLGDKSVTATITVVKPQTAMASSAQSSSPSTPPSPRGR